MAASSLYARATPSGYPTPGAKWREEQTGFYVRYPGHYESTDIARRWTFESARLALTDLVNEVHQLRINLVALEAEFRRNRDARMVDVQTLDLPDFPAEEVERVAQMVLSELETRSGSTDIIDFSEKTDTDPRLAAQAFRLLQKRGQLVEA